MNTILSLFDYSGNWSKPYRENGYNVIQVDIKHGISIFDLQYKQIKNVYGILAAPPCTDYSLSGARWFAKKDINGQTEESNKLVRKTLEIINYLKPTFWVVENPMSRIHKLHPELGEVKFKFNPYDFGDSHQKMTWLWGKFNDPIKTPGKNLGNWMFTNLGGKSERTKELRSETPMGFACAFYKANNMESKNALLYDRW